MATDVDDIELAALVKGRERYIVMFRSNDDERRDAIRTLCRWAENPDLSFTDHDALTMADRMRADWAAEATPRDTGLARTPPAVMSFWLWLAFVVPALAWVLWRQL